MMNKQKDLRKAYFSHPMVAACKNHQGLHLLCIRDTFQYKIYMYTKIDITTCLYVTYYDLGLDDYLSVSDVCRENLLNIRSVLLLYFIESLN